MEPVIDNEPDQTDSDRGGANTDVDKTDGEDSVLTPAQSRSPSVRPPDEDGPDLFDGYSFKGRHSVLIDDDEDPEEEDEEVAEEMIEEDRLDEDQERRLSIAQDPFMRRESLSIRPSRIVIRRVA